MTSTRRAVSGMTLIELVIASALGAILLIATTQVAQLFTQQVTYLREEANDELETCGELIANDLRRAWSVTSVSTQSISLEDAYGDVTTYAFVGSELIVTRPSGDSGVLLDNVTNFTITTDTTPRYREAAPTDDYAAWYSSTGSGTTTSVLLQPGQELGLGFIASSDAPPAVELANGVDELRLETHIEQLTITCDMVNLTDKVFWHFYGYPPNNNPPSTVSDDALGDLTLTLYEARSPGSGVPYGGAVATTSISLGSLPNNSYQWIRDVTGEVVDPPNGAAYGWWTNNSDVNFSVGVPSAPVTLAVPTLATAIEPGHAYTIALGVTGNAAVVVRAKTTSSGLESLAYKADAASSFTASGWAVPFNLEGTNTYTQTTVHNVVTNVTVNFTLADGSAHTASAAITAQTVASDPWFGAVPGELPTIQSP